MSDMDDLRKEMGEKCRQIDFAILALRGENQASDAELRGEIQGLRNQIRSEIKALRNEMRRAFEQAHENFERQLAEQEKRIVDQLRAVLPRGT